MLFLLFISLFSFADEKDPHYQKCFNEKDPAIARNHCEIHSARIMEEQNRKDLSAIRAQQRACELGSPYTCDNLLISTEFHQPTYLPTMLSFVKDNCNRGLFSTCDALALYYEEHNDFPKALEYSRLHHQKYKEGQYKYLAYKYGDKQIAFKLSLEDCEMDSSKCISTLRFMPDHPQYATIVNNVEKSCLSLSKTDAAFDCAIIGTYYHKNGNPKKAQELWGRACSQSYATGCLLLMASQNPQSKRIEAAQEFCTMKKFSLFDNGNLSELRKPNCPSVIQQKRIPASLQKKSDETLRSYMKLQD